MVKVLTILDGDAMKSMLSDCNVKPQTCCGQSKFSVVRKLKFLRVYVKMYAILHARKRCHLK